MEARPSTSLIGTVLDERYRIVSLLGEGGMGAVYRAEQPEGPAVAIKVLHEELGEDPEQRERFEREARALFGLEHPHILAVVDFGIVSGNPYLAMELLEGKSLDEMVEDGPLAPETAFELGAQMLRGMAFAHGNGVLHRDLKSENVHVSVGRDGRSTVKLLDFGLAKFTDDDRWGSSKKLTVAGSIMGTPAYMAPEQCAGAPVDARGDVYSAGVLLYELFTGEWPFMEETRMKMFQAHFMKPAPTLGDAALDYAFRPELDAVIQRAMAKPAEQRFQNAGEMLTALEAVPRPVASRIGTDLGSLAPLTAAPVATGPVYNSPPAQPPSGDHVVLKMVLAAVVLAVIVAAVVLVILVIA